MRLIPTLALLLLIPAAHAQSPVTLTAGPAEGDTLRVNEVTFAWTGGRGLFGYELIGPIVRRTPERPNRPPAERAFGRVDTTAATSTTFAKLGDGAYRLRVWDAARDSTGGQGALRTFEVQATGLELEVTNYDGVPVAVFVERIEEPLPNTAPFVPFSVEPPGTTFAEIDEGRKLELSARAPWHWRVEMSRDPAFDARIYAFVRTTLEDGSLHLVHPDSMGLLQWDCDGTNYRLAAFCDLSVGSCGGGPHLQVEPGLKAVFMPNTEPTECSLYEVAYNDVLDPGVRIVEGPDRNSTVEADSVTFTWRGRDPDGQIVRYDLEWQGPSVNLTSVVSDTSATFATPRGGAYTFRVRATDDDGLTSRWESRPFQRASPVAAEAPGDLAAAEAPTLYPNPATTSTTVRFSLARPQLVRVRVLDVLGRTTAALLDASLGQGRHEQVVDVSGWPAGLYFVEITTAESSTVQALVTTR
ncbi:MAG: T9SS type A sorting domain-containing protein [Bacteroidota bacterium]